MFRRFALFFAVNLLVVLTISVLLTVFDVKPYLRGTGVDYEQLAVYCLIWGMSGSLVSLALSRLIAKLVYGVQLITPETRDPELQGLLSRVHGFARAAGLSEMPEVGVYDSGEVNAYATGPTRSRSLVAVSTGLLNNMTPDEVDGVLAHEVSHIANGDMVTMALLQGVVNSFVYFLSRAIGFAVARGGRDGRENRGLRILVTFVLEIVLTILGSILVMWFSRQREYRADAGAARLAGRERMIAALRRLQRMHDVVDTESSPALATMKISGRGGWLALFSSHPPLEERIARLRSTY